MGREYLSGINIDKSYEKQVRGSNIVEVNSDAVNGYCDLGPLPALAALFLAENLASNIVTGSIWAVEGAGKRLQHIGRVYLKLGSHFERDVAAYRPGVCCQNEGLAILVKLRSKKSDCSTEKFRWVLNGWVVKWNRAGIGSPAHL